MQLEDVTLIGHTDRQAKELEQSLIAQLRNLLDGEENHIANMANTTALLFSELAHVNWVGFYLYDDEQLVLGPFQGKPAVTRIKLGNGVCGAAAEQRRTIRVGNVCDFVGHIACDPNSRAEIVVPLIKDEYLIGVLDLDSPLVDRFTSEDQQLLEAVAQIITSIW
jgi:L-methionine (R)-S-oxide reductase